MIFLLMDSSSKKRVEQEATELSEKIFKIAEMVSERKLRTLRLASSKARSSVPALICMRAPRSIINVSI
jgi:hypothetical protein